jgi:2-(3-amino-3-carboxypropyl)histidine synthase
VERIKTRNPQPSLILMYNLDTERVAEEIEKRGASSVLLQLPDGLRPTAFRLSKELKQRTGAEILISGDSCYGACDLALDQADAIGADLIVHYGHSRMIETSTPVIYVEAVYDFDVQALIEDALPFIAEWDSVGLTTTAQHIHKIHEVAQILELEGLKPQIGEKGDGHPGQILGCDYATAESISHLVQGYLYIGAGRFHPLGLAVNTGKPVAIADPYTMEARMLDERQVTRLAMRRMAAIKIADKAQTFGVLLSTKPGQLSTSTAQILQEKLRGDGRDAAIIVLDEITTLRLGDFTEPQAFIVMACPRIAIDGLPDENRPLLTPTETLIVLNEKTWEAAWGQGYIG